MLNQLVHVRWQVHNTMATLTQTHTGANISLILNQFSHNCLVSVPAEALGFTAKGRGYDDVIVATIKGAPTSIVTCFKDEDLPL